MPVEVKAIGSSFLNINQNIEKLRSEKTNAHGKTTEDYIVQDTLYAYFILNSVAAVGTFLISYYKNKFPKLEIKQNEEVEDDLPF